MSWVRHSAALRMHICAAPSTGVGLTTDQPVGDRGDLWRCDGCKMLWEVRSACDMCDRMGSHDAGLCTVGSKWRVAGPWKRIRYNDISPRAMGWWLFGIAVWFVASLYLIFGLAWGF